MEFGGKGAKGSRRHLKSAADLKNCEYGHNVNMYTHPPAHVISLIEFEELAIERLKILKAFDSMGQMEVKFSSVYMEKIEAEIRKHGANFMKIATKATDVDADGVDKELSDCRKRDHISHFILRLAFCKTPESRQWFLQQEVDLFRYRIKQEGPKSIDTFLTINDMHFEMLRSMERDDLSAALISSFAISGDKFRALNDNIYKVPFTEALDLVKNRKVLVRYGFAYVRAEDMVSIVAGRFRTNLSKFLTMTSRYIDFMQEQERLGPVLQRLTSNAYLGKNYNNPDDSPDAVTPDMIDGLSRISFPLCMRRVHEQLKREHHVKHGGRMQYGLFLKAIGLGLDDALRFWRSEFSKAMDSEKFDKHYAYNIRHNYGKEGKRADYTPYSCSKIIMNNQPATGDCHGCPFKHSDASLLQQRLKDLKLDKEQTDDILNLCKSSRYDQACTRYFELSHKLEEGALGQLITHPNAYYEESRRILSAEIKPVAIKREHVGVFTQKNETVDSSIDESLVDMKLP